MVLAEKSLTSVAGSRARVRVLQVAATLQIGGSEQLASSIGRGLDPARYESFFAAVGPNGPIGEALRVDGYSVTTFDRRDGLDLRLFPRVWKFLHEVKPDIVQTHHVASLIYGGLPARLSGAKVIHTEHEINTFRQFPRQLKWLRRLSPLVDRFVVIDPSIATFLEEAASIERSRIRVIRNGIDLHRFLPSKVRSSAGLTIGWLARLDPPKRPDLVIEAFRRLRDRGADVRLRMIGPGSLQEGVRRQVSELGLGDVVETPGPKSDVPEQLQRMDVYVLVSDAEGLPISLAEAMACGLPCVASAVGGIPSLLRQGQNGLLLEKNSAADLAEHLWNLISDPARRALLGAAARQTIVEQFDFARTIAQYADLFAEVMA